MAFKEFLLLTSPVTIPSGIVVLICVACAIFGPAVERWRDRHSG